MGNPHSKATEQTKASDVPPGPMEEIECVAGPMEGTNVDDYNPEVITVANDVDEVYPSSSGVHYTPSERVILEQTDGDRTYVHEPSHLISDNPTISFLYNEASLPAPSNLTQDYATDLAQSSNAVHAPGSDALEVLPVSDATSDHMTTGVVVKKNFADEKREQKNAQRRAAYRKKKEEATVKQHNENQPSLTIAELAIQLNKEEKREQIKARRRAAYQKKDDEGVVNVQSDVQNIARHPLDGGPAMTPPTYTVGTDADLESFLSGIMGEDPMPPDFMDDEYYLFGGQGSDVDSMDGYEDTNMYSMDVPAPIDPFDYVYSNLPDNTHILKHAANCNHCKAMKL